MSGVVSIMIKWLCCNLDRFERMGRLIGELFLQSTLSLCKNRGYTVVVGRPEILRSEPVDQSGQCTSNTSFLANTYCIPFLFRSAASSLCFCSIACLNLLASPYCLLIRFFVTFSHNFLLSVGNCFSKGLTIFGITCS